MPFTLARHWQQGWLAAWCAIALVWAIDAATGALAPLQRHLTEWTTEAVPLPAAPEVVLVNIDDASLAAFGPWPWPREMHARLIDRLTEANAGAVAYSLPWLGPEPREALNQINRLAQAVAADPQLAEHAQLNGWVQQSQVLLDGDSRLAQSLAQNQRTALAVAARSAAGGGWPLAALVSASAGVGHVALGSEEDGVTRTLTLMEQRGDRRLPALPLAAVALWKHRSLADLQWERAGLGARRAVFDKWRWPVDSEGQLHPLWVSEQTTPWIQRWSAADLLAGRQPPQGLAGRLVVVGLQVADPATGSHLTPRSALSTGEVQAQVAAALIHDHLIARPPWSALAPSLLVLGLSLYLMIALPRLRPATGAAATGLLSLLMLTAAFLCMAALKTEVPVVLPLTALWAGHAAMLLARRFSAGSAHQAERLISSATLPAGPPPFAQQTTPRTAEPLDLGTTRPLQGPTVGAFQLQYEIGRGAMGRVYRAVQSDTGRVVAVKTLALAREFNGFALQEAKQRFQREALAASRLQHPDIVRILDTGDNQGQVWIAMELLSGHDLVRHTSDGNLLPVPTVLEICARIAAALAHAHTHGVVHRDIKPANVMVELPEHGGAKLSVTVMDFGIARITDAARTRTGLVLGSPSYMSPEHLAGRSVDGRSDLYSLGVLMFQMLTGQLPFQGSTVAELMHAVANLPAPDVRTLRPRLPEAVSNIVTLALEKRPELRYGDGQQLAADLRCVAALWRHPASPPPAAAQANRRDSTTV